MSAQIPLLTAQPHPDWLNYIDTLTFPFKQPNWIARLWWVPILLFIPVFNIVVMRGWRLDVARRVGTHKAELLPEIHDIGRFFAEGMLLWLMSGIYFIPRIIILAVSGFTVLETILTILTWLFQVIFTDNQVVSFGALLAEIGFAALMQFVFPVIYFVVSYPLYRVAMVRYALSGRAGVFFEIPTNVRLFFGSWILVLSVFFFFFLTGVLVATFTGLFAATVVGSLLVIILIAPMYYWTNGYLFGILAQRLAHQAPNKAPAAQPSTPAVLEPPHALACANCQTPNPQHAQFCYRCGNPLGGTPPMMPTGNAME